MNTLDQHLKALYDELLANKANNDRQDRALFILTNAIIETRKAIRSITEHENVTPSEQPRKTPSETKGAVRDDHWSGE